MLAKFQIENGAGEVNLDCSSPPTDNHTSMVKKLPHPIAYISKLELKGKGKLVACKTIVSSSDKTRHYIHLFHAAFFFSSPSSNVMPPLIPTLPASPALPPQAQVQVQALHAH
jgi:hypothetical protein